MLGALYRNPQVNVK